VINKNVKNCVVFALIIILIFSTATSIAVSEVMLQKEPNERVSTVSFIEKSSGLETPAKEGGDTELELADINNDGHLDIICVGDHGSPYVNSGQHGIMVWLGDGENTWSVNQTGDFGYGGIEAGI